MYKNDSHRLQSFRLRSYELRIDDTLRNYDIVDRLTNEVVGIIRLEGPPIPVNFLEHNQFEFQRVSS